MGNWCCSNDEYVFIEKKKYNKSTEPIIIPKNTNTKYVTFRYPEESFSFSN